MLLEICAANYQSAINAQNAGADRIELCSELGVGGITPSIGLLEKVCKNLTIPVFVIIRPRSGDFVYSEDEIEIMCRDIEICIELGCKGIVSGALTSDFEIDIAKTKRLLSCAKQLEFTFHRGFDLLQNPKRSLKQLEDLGVARILSSGQQSTAAKGLPLLNALKQSANRLTILPGGGINTTNIESFKDLGFLEVHASASKLLKIAEEVKLQFNTPKFLDESMHLISDFEIIRELKSKMV